MCLACGTILVYNADLSLHEITEDELLNLSASIRGFLLRMTEARREVVGDEILDYMKRKQKQRSS